MREWAAEELAAAAGAELVRPPRRSRPEAAPPGPEHVTIDSREAVPGALFVGIPGARVDGGSFAPDVLRAGAWGALVTPERGREAAAADGGEGAVLIAADPVGALGRLARAWRRELACRVIAVTGSTGKTSTKDILAALLAPARRTVASRANLNTEIGLPLQILAAPRGTEVLVLELAMRGAGQIAELAEICAPDVGVIVNVGPVHLELLGSLEAVAAAKAELLVALAPGGTAVVPAGEPLLAPHLHDELHTVSFGPGGDAELLGTRGSSVEVALGGGRFVMELSFSRPHLRTNLLAALLAARAVGVEPPPRLEVVFSAGRGDRIEAPGGVLVLDDCYNANPMSMRAALDDLAATASVRGGRRVAVLGDMLELGPAETAYHEELGRQAARSGVDLLVTVGPLAAAAAAPFGGITRRAGDAAEAAELLPSLLEAGDTVLVKASNGVGLAEVSRRLAAPAL